MDSGVAAAVGVIAGALVTGGVQSIGGLLHRGLSGRIAARLVYHDLSAAHTSILRAQVAGTWDLDLDSVAAQATWNSQREALARALRTIDFVEVANGFETIQLVTSESRRYLASDQTEFTGDNKVLATAVTFLDAGCKAALRECLSPWERLTGSERATYQGRSVSSRCPKKRTTDAQGGA